MRLKATSHAGPRRPRRLHLAVACLLLGLTATVGLAVRGSGSHGVESPPLLESSNGTLRLTTRLDRDAVLQGQDGQVRLELAIGGIANQTAFAPRTPTDLVIVLDRSGSMRGEPLAAAKSAVRELLSQLAPDDRFALVTYASGAQLIAPLSGVGGDDGLHWQRVLDGIAASGGTHLASGLDVAHDVIAESQRVGRAPRIVLLSDGHANEGDHSLEGLRRRALRAVNGEYVLSTVGIGQGFDESLMSALADAGTGNFYYVAHAHDLADVFAGEFAAARETVASALAVRIETANGVEVLSAAGYPLERTSQGSAVVFRPGDLFAGQERRVWLNLRVPTRTPGEQTLGGLSVSFSDASGTRRELVHGALPTVATVASEDDYYAAYNADAWRSAQRVEGIGELKDRVAKALREGRQAEAVSQVEAALDNIKSESLRSLGYVADEDVSELESLRGTVSAPAAAKPAEQNRLGKQLLQESRDQRRAGGKHR